MRIREDSRQDRLVWRLYSMALRRLIHASYKGLATHDDWSMPQLCHHSVVSTLIGLLSCGCLVHYQHPGSLRFVFHRQAARTGLIASTNTCELIQHSQLPREDDYCFAAMEKLVVTAEPTICSPKQQCHNSHHP
jgi:hypothetical protein